MQHVQVFRKDLFLGYFFMFIKSMLFLMYVSKDVELLLFAGNINVFLYDMDIDQLSIRANKSSLRYKKLTGL